MFDSKWRNWARGETGSGLMLQPSEAHSEESKYPRSIEFIKPAFQVLCMGTAPSQLGHQWDLQQVGTNGVVLNGTLSYHGEPSSLETEGGYQQGTTVLWGSHVDADKKKQLCS